MLDEVKIERVRARSEVPADRRPKAAGPRVSKTIINFVVDAVLMVLVVGLLFVAATLRFVFPSPSRAAGWTLWGLSFDAWSNVQFVLVTILGSAIVLHVMLHWSWVCGVLVTRLMRRTKGGQTDDGQQTLWGVGLLIAIVNLLGLLVGLAYLTIRGPAG